MAETKHSPPHSAATTAGNSPFSIWPPNERTRGTVRNRLIKSLSTPSPLSNKYGMISPEEAVEAAKRIEEEAYEAAEKATDSNGDGIEILQFYSKVISKRMLETVQSKSVQSSAPENPPADVTAAEEDDAGSLSLIKSEKMDDN